MPSDALRQLADEYWEAALRRNPILATFFGDYRYNDRLPDIGPAGRAEEEEDLKQALQRLEPIEHGLPDLEDQITASMLRLSLEAGLAALRLRLDEMAVDQMEGPQVWLLELLNWHPTDTREHVEQLIARYQTFPTFMEQYLENLRDGAGDGRTAPTIAVERVTLQLEAIVATPPAESPLSGGGRLKLTEMADRLPPIVERVIYPAYRQFLEFLRTYTPRPEPGIWSVTDGAEIYALLASQHTTTSLTPDELHQIGRDDLASIHAEMRAIMRQHGDGAASIRAFTERLIHNPSNLPGSREEIVAESERLLAEAQAALPRAFGRLPRTPCIVKPIEDFRERDAPAARRWERAPM